MMTTLLLMGAQGSTMIVAVLVLRALLLDHLPKATFCALWALVAARLHGSNGHRWDSPLGRFFFDARNQQFRSTRNAGCQRFADRSPHTCRRFSAARPHGADRRSTTGHTR